MKKLYKAVLFITLIFSAAQAMASGQAASTCNWQARNPFTSFSDSCPTAPTLIGYIGFNTTNSNCFKYKWTVNGVNAGTTRYLTYRVTQNGTYNICVAVTDTCNNCDTVFCSTRNISCIPNIPTCNWANLYTAFWDSCTSSNKALYGYATQGSNCWKYQWKLNGAIVGTTRMLSYPVTQNGSYTLCLTITDTCTHCDTTICSVRGITCIPNTPVCNWSNLYTSFFDTCTGTKRSVNGYASLGSNCWKYTWKVNGNTVGTSRILHYPVTANGTYVVCLTVIDTCAHCDTVICSTRILNCTTVPTCNWANLFTSITDSCTNTKRAVFGYATLNNCWKYTWKVNGETVGTTRTLTYNITQNGSYNVCLTVNDTCSHCDTTICSTRSFTCITPPPVCNWANLYTSFWDSCTVGKKALNGYATQGNNCWKYQWKLNGLVIGTSRILYYPVLQNGTYNLCLTITDTCAHCDTTICSVRVLTCTAPPACNWSTINTAFWDTCSLGKRSVNAYVSINNSLPCFKYQWKVNGNIVSTDRILHYNVLQNGTYVVCVTIIDTCTHCDTTICSTRILNCTTVPTCNWANLYTSFFDTCTSTKKSVNGYASLGSNCWKYTWKMNGAVIGTTRILHYPLSANGTYTVCLTVTDTCTHCDTTICSVRELNCPAACTWSTRNPYVSFWDSCTTRVKGVNGYIAFNSDISCMKFQWKVNGAVVGTTRWLYYPVIQNGTYNVCVTVIDTCNHCDTTFCSTRVINCNPPYPCNWRARNAYVNFWDSCTSRKKALNGYIYFANTLNDCNKYQWLVNGQVVATGRVLNYPVSQNGTYVVCVKVTDTCNHCDTMYCSTRILNCISTGPCNWNNRHPYTSFNDSCTGTNRSLNGYITFNSNMSCLKFQWKVNGQNAGTGRWLNYPVSINGTYNVCVTVTDTCDHCDTTFCSTRTITCINPNTPCNWKSRNPYIFFWDSCTATKKSVNGYIAFNSSINCLKFQWTVNGHPAGTGRILTYPVTQNGTYVVCVSVIDTCNHCDTSFCSTRIINCINTSPGCNWSNTHPYTYFWDSCFGGIHPYSVNGYISFNSNNIACFKYQWKVNGAIVGTGRILNYPVTQNGTYNVCVSVIDTCNHCDTTFCSTRTITCVHFTDPQNTVNVADLQIYPNPSRGLVNVYCSEESCTYMLTNISGQVLQSGTFMKGNQQFDMTAFPTDIYILKVQTKSMVLTRKISLQN